MSRIVRRQKDVAASFNIIEEEMESIKKISVKAVVGKFVFAAGETRHPLCTVLGVVTGARMVSTDFGPETLLRGQFEAIDAETGETFDAELAALPDDLTRPILEALKKDAVQFAARIDALKDDSLGGCQFKVTYLVAPSVADPLAALRAASVPPVAFAVSGMAAAAAAESKTAAKK